MKIGIKDGETFRIYSKSAINLAMLFIWVFGVLFGVIIGLFGNEKDSPVTPSAIVHKNSGIKYSGIDAGFGCNVVNGDSSINWGDYVGHDLKFNDTICKAYGRWGYDGNGKITHDVKNKIHKKLLPQSNSEERWVKLALTEQIDTQILVEPKIPVDSFMLNYKPSDTIIGNNDTIYYELNKHHYTIKKLDSIKISGDTIYVNGGIIKVH